MAQAALVLAMACGGGGGGGGDTITNVAPQITTPPASQTVSAGSAATFTVAASGTPAPTFTWQRSNDNGTTWTAISGATNATYTFTAAKADHTAQFRVTASNTVSPDATSTAATLSVQWLAITTQPGDKSVTAGSPATFTVVPDANPAATLQWQSSADGTTWANVAGATAASYPIAATALSSSGTKFRCVLTNATGSINSNAATLTVTALGVAPTITTHPVSVTVTAGSPATFTVVATGTAPLHYQWKKGTTNVGTDSATYTIAAAAAGDAGSYTVTVSNGFGTTVVTSNAATLTVTAQGAAPAITTQPASTSVTAGSPASFTVVATGTAPLHYQWKKGTTNVGTDSATYSIAAAAAGDEGSYTVTVTNTAGTLTSSAATLTVTALAVAPAITTQPANATVTVGSPATFTVVATGTGPLHYQWKKGVTNVGPDAATYTIAATVIGDAASYTVTVSNTAGTLTSSAATLTVVAAPVITTFTNAGLLSDGTGASLTVNFSNGTGVVNGPGLSNVPVVNGNVSLAAAGSIATDSTYMLIVTNGANTSVWATTTVAVTPVFTTNPAPQKLVVGSTATFTVAAASPFLITGYTWQRSNDGGATWAAIPSAAGPSYTTPTLALSDNGALFQAIATNAKGSTTSQVAGLNEVLTVTVNGIPIDLILVPAGTYTMGETETTVGTYPSSKTKHPVTFAKAFYLSKTPCTQELWLAIMGNNPTAFNPSNSIPFDLQRPVDTVSFDDIATTTTTPAYTCFIDALNLAATTRPGSSTFRLPTEAEYEYACRAGSTTNYYFGSCDTGNSNDVLIIDQHMWSVNNSGNITHPVGVKTPNAWGLYDMIGQVWQVCQDDWHASYDTPAGAGVPVRPDDGTAWVDTPRTTGRSERGGSFDLGIQYGQSKLRGPYAQTYKDWNTGFRLVLQVP